MSTPFSRSMRSLQGSGIQASLLGLILVLLLLVIWLGWFFLARVGVYEFSTRIQIADDGTVRADFARAAQGRIKLYQPAYLRLDGEIGKQAGLIPAIVIESQNLPNEDRVQTDFVVYWETVPSVTPQKGLTGQMEVEIESISPAVMVLRAAGFFIKQPVLQVSPQEPGNGN